MSKIRKILGPLEFGIERRRIAGGDRSNRPSFFSPSRLP